MKIYLDNCALGRLFDEDSQPRIRAEAAAMRNILRLVALGQAQWFSSTALEAEIAQNTNAVRRRSTQILLEGATRLLHSTPSIAARLAALQAVGFTHFDAQHLAFAEAAEADIFLTTDDRLIRKARRLVQASPGSGTRTLTVTNPVNWLRGNMR